MENYASNDNHAEDRFITEARRKDRAEIERLRCRIAEQDIHLKQQGAEINRLIEEISVKSTQPEGGE